MSHKHQPDVGQFQNFCREKRRYQISLNTTNCMSERNKITRNTHESLLEERKQSQLYQDQADYQQEGHKYSTSIDLNRRQGEFGVTLNICECCEHEQDKEDKLEVTVNFSKHNIVRVKVF